MKAIYASKLFVTSKRKEQIKAALLSTANEGLVQQLAEDLDEQYQTPDNLGEETKESEDNSSKGGNDEFDEFTVDDDIDPENDLVTVDDLGTHSKSAPHSAPPKKSEKSEESSSDKPEPDTSELIPESPANEKPAPEPEASTQVENKSEVKATTVVDLNVLKGTLNGRVETAGVIRIAEKENEIWIYYNDDVNLNDVMVDVIECITCLDVQPLEFNRLARSDNAIVFVKGAKSTLAEPESIDSETSND